MIASSGAWGQEFSGRNLATCILAYPSIAMARTELSSTVTRMPGGDQLLRPRSGVSPTRSSFGRCSARTQRCVIVLSFCQSIPAARTACTEGRASIASRKARILGKAETSTPSPSSQLHTT